MTKSEYLYIYNNHGLSCETMYEFYQYYSNKPINYYDFKSAYEKWKIKTDRLLVGQNREFLKEKFEKICFVINDSLMRHFHVIKVYSSDNELITIY